MKRASRGFTLVELMIAMIIGLFIAGAAGSVYITTKKIFNVEQSLSHLQESGRFALGFLESELRSADFRGCAGAFITPSVRLNPGSFPYTVFDAGVAGFDGQGGGWNPSLPSGFPSAPAPKSGTDIISISRPAGPGLDVMAPYMPTTASALQVSPSPDAPNQFDIVIVSDCAGADIFQVTNPSVATSGTIVHNPGVGTPGNISGLSRTYGQGAEVIKLSAVSFYVAPSTLMAGVNSLWRQLDGGAPDELVQGVDDMQILYGVAVPPNRSASLYQTAADVETGAAWPNVVSVRVSLLLSTLNESAHAPQPYTFNGVTHTPTDRKMRSVVTSVVALRNRVP